MPELPDIEVYLDHLRSRLAGQQLERVRLVSPFLLRSVDPPLSEIIGKPIKGIRRMGKRIVFEFDDELFLVLHLMIAGRLRWRDAGTDVPGKVGLAAFDFPNGTLVVTEAGAKKRASLHVVRGAEGLAGFSRGGLEVLESSLEAFAATLTRENHTLKRTLTDPRLFSGIGNAYSDEILHRARLSPVRLSRQLKPDEIERLYHATLATLREWVDRLRAETGEKFPEKVTAFRKGMAVHGRFGQPCPECGAPVQRIRYANNETNYCPDCQTGGRLMADRGLSRLLKKDWPRSLEEMEELKGR
jgi:formamidopyrimidine-DNA glycosylase